MKLPHIIKLLFKSLLLLCICNQCYALSPNTRAALKKFDIAESALSRADESKPYVPAIMMISDEAVVDHIVSLGTIIYHRRENMLLVSIPRDVVEEIEDLDGVYNIESMIQAESCMDIARAAGNVDAVHLGSDLPMAYDGTGVIAAFSDTGFDPHHIVFGDRVSHLFDYKAYEGNVLMAQTPAEVEAWNTDNDEQFHATHVANIMAGGYKGNPYYGVAPGSQIVGCTSDLTDAGILSTIEDIISVSKQTGMPAVINLSIGSMIGPRDGTDLICRYLSLCAQDAIICAAAGNNGRGSISAVYTFTSDTPVVRCAVNTYQGYDGFNVSGVTDFWSRDERPFQLRYEVYDTDNQMIVYSSEWTETGDDIEMKINAEVDPDWGQYMEGEITAYAGWGKTNGRYCITAVYDTQTTEQSSRGQWSKYLTSLAIMGEDGVTVNVYADGSQSYLGKVSGGLPTLYPNADQSISNICCAEGVIAVGAFSTRNTAPAIDGSEFAWNFDIDAPAGFSSYGDTYWGEPLPHICGPGNYVVSAISHCYTDKYNINPAAVSASADVDGHTYYWFPACGTSMATPFVSGAIALWLQAYPELTADQAMDIAMSTANSRHADMGNPRWGAGSIDVLAGLKKAIALSGIIAPQADPIAIATADRRIEVIGIDPSSVKIYSLSGMQVDPSASLAPGVYIVTAPSLTQKVIVR